MTMQELDVLDLVISEVAFLADLATGEPCEEDPPQTRGLGPGRV